METFMSGWSGPERRRTARCATALTHGGVCVRIRPGHDVRLIDVSAGGVFVQNVVRLLPGHSVELLITTDERRAAVRGLVIRSVVSHVSRSAIWYRSAVAFEHLVPWLSDVRDVEYREYGLRARESAPNVAARASGSRI
jgi:hypothetical protein